jgi:hypothetical protein
MRRSSLRTRARSASFWDSRVMACCPLSTITSSRRMEARFWARTSASLRAKRYSGDGSGETAKVTNVGLMYQ